MKNKIKNSIAVIVIILSVIGLGSVVLGESEPHYAGYGACVPEGIRWGYVEYQIQYGDTVSGIAADFMEQYPLIETFIGFDHQVEEIIRVNGLKNPNKINEDCWLLVPVVSEHPIENRIN